MNIGFSRTFRAVVALCGVQHASAEQAEAGAAIHRSFQHLEPVYLAFRGARGPRKVERRLYGTDISAQTGNKRTERRASRLVEHFIQGLLALAAQDGVEP